MPPTRSDRCRPAARRARQPDRQRARGGTRRGSARLAKAWSPSARDVHRAAVVIEVTDTGTGIEPDVASQVFEPYFTTRRKGTGLGLAIARNIIEGLGGTIALTSTPGAGTVGPHHAAAGETRTDDARHRAARGRRGEDPQDAGPGAARGRARGHHDLVAAGGAAAARRAAVRRPDRRLPDARAHRHGRRARAAGDAARARTAGRADDDRARHRPQRRRGDEARRPRLPAEALRHRRTARQRASRRRGAAGAQRPAVPAVGAEERSSASTASSDTAARCRT